MAYQDRHRIMQPVPRRVDGFILHYLRYLHHSRVTDDTNHRASCGDVLQAQLCLHTKGNHKHQGRHILGNAGCYTILLALSRWIYGIFNIQLHHSNDHSAVHYDSIASSLDSAEHLQGPDGGFHIFKLYLPDLDNACSEYHIGLEDRDGHRFLLTVRW